MGASGCGRLPSAFFNPHSPGAEPLCSLAVSLGSPRQQGSSANRRPRTALSLHHRPSTSLGAMAAVAAASAELLIIGWYIFRVLLQTPSDCARANPAAWLGTKSWGAAGARRGLSSRLLETNVVFLECCIYWVGFAFRNTPGTQPIARSEVFRYSLQKLAYTVSRTGRQVLGERRQRAPH